MDFDRSMMQSESNHKSFAIMTPTNNLINHVDKSSMPPIPFYDMSCTPSKIHIYLQIGEPQILFKKMTMTCRFSTCHQAFYKLG